MLTIILLAGGIMVFGVHLIGAKYCGIMLKHLEQHQKMNLEVISLRQTIISELSTIWADKFNSYMNGSYLDFLDRAYQSRYHESFGFSFKLPADVLKQPSIDIDKYFTEDEAAAIRKAREIYGDDSRLSAFDKRLGL